MPTVASHSRRHIKMRKDWRRARLPPTHNPAAARSICWQPRLAGSRGCRLWMPQEYLKSVAARLRGRKKIRARTPKSLLCAPGGSGTATNKRKGEHAVQADTGEQRGDGRKH